MVKYIVRNYFLHTLALGVYRMSLRVWAVNLVKPGFREYQQAGKIFLLGDKMFKIAICDDSDYMREETKKYILKYSFQKDFDYSLDEYETGEKLLASKETYDLIFMDYQYEDTGADGITIAKELRRGGDDAVIIFLSSYPSVVFQSFDVGTFRFLVKPIEEEKFNDALDAFVQSMSKEKVLSVHVHGMDHVVKENTISYIEGFGKHCIIHFADQSGELECNETLASVGERLPSNHFFRCYKSFIVNLKHVSSYNHTDVVLDNGEQILMSRTKYKEFTQAYSDYLTGHGRK